MDDKPKGLKPGEMAHLHGAKCHVYDKQGIYPQMERIDYQQVTHASSETPSLEDRQKEHGITEEAAHRLELALCTLGDFEGPLKDVLVKLFGTQQGHTQVCAAIRHLVDE